MARSNAEDALVEALKGRQEAEGRLREAIAAQHSRKLPQAPDALADAARTKRKAPVGLDRDTQRHNTARPTVPERKKKAAAPTIVSDSARTIQARRRGWPDIASEQKSETLKWSKPRSMGTGDSSMGGTLRKRGRGRPKGSKNRPKT